MWPECLGIAFGGAGAATGYGWFRATLKPNPK